MLLEKITSPNPNNKEGLWRPLQSHPLPKGIRDNGNCILSILDCGNYILNTLGAEGLRAGCLHSFPFRNFTLDHIVPQSQGGGNEATNLQLLCGACNSVKGSKPIEYLIAQLKKQGIR